MAHHPRRSDNGQLSEHALAALFHHDRETDAISRQRLHWLHGLSSQVKASVDDLARLRQLTETKIGTKPSPDDLMNRASAPMAHPDGPQCAPALGAVSLCAARDETARRAYRGSLTLVRRPTFGPRTRI
jgi:hypothetical protein